MQILESASKIVFIILAVALVFLTYFGIVEADKFMTVVFMTFTFYFSSKGDPTKPYSGK